VGSLERSVYSESVIMWLVLIFRAAGVHVLCRLAITLGLQGPASSAGGVLLYVLSYGFLP